MRNRFRAVVAITLGTIVLAWLMLSWTERGAVGAPEDPAPEALTPNLEGERMVFLAVNTDVAAARLLASWFHADTGAVVEVREVAYDRMLDAFLDDVHSESPRYDVVEIWYPTIARLVERQAIRELDTLLQHYERDIQTEDFFEAVYGAYSRYAGRTWAIPYDVDTHLLFYRKSLLERYGLQPPETWAELHEAARIITENERSNGIYGLATMAYPTPIINVSMFLNRLAGYGGQFLDDNGQPTLDSPEALAALQAVIDVLPYSMPTALETDYEVSRDAFLAGRVAMVDQWSDLGVYADDPRYSTIVGDWGVAPLPSGRPGGGGAALNAGFSLALSAAAPNPDVAEAFLLYASSPAIQKRLNLSATGIDVGRYSVLESPAFRQQFPELVDAVEAAFGRDVATWPVLPNTPELMAALSDRIALAVSGEMTPADALQEAQADWERLLQPTPGGGVGKSH